MSYLINWASITRYTTHFSGILSSPKFAWKRIYTVLAAQGLIWPNNHSHSLMICLVNAGSMSETLAQHQSRLDKNLAEQKMKWIGLYATFVHIQDKLGQGTSRDEWDDSALLTQGSKFKPWRSEGEHVSSRSQRLPTILSFTSGSGRKTFVSFKPPRPVNEPHDRMNQWWPIVGPTAQRVGQHWSNIGSMNRIQNQAEQARYSELMMV